MTPRPPLVIGHRGAPGYRPEHTAASFELAIAQGADAVEPDLVVSRDGELVIRHENEISSTTDVAEHPEFADRRTTKTVDGVERTGWFTEDFDWDELATLRARERLKALRGASAEFDGGERILRLPDLLELLDRVRDSTGRSVGLVAELKHATYFDGLGSPLDELVLRDLRLAGWEDDDRVTVESFEASILDRLRRAGAGARRVYLIEAEGAPADRVAADGEGAAPYAADLTDAGLASLGERMQGISVPIAVLDPDLRASGRNARGRNPLVDRAHAAGLDVYVWTLRPENRFLPTSLRRGFRKSAFGDWWTLYEAVIGSDVDGVFADHPDLAVEVRDSHDFAV